MKSLQEKMKESFQQKLMNCSESKSKMQYYLQGKKDKNTWKRADYLNKLTRNQASVIFRARTRMLKVKANFRNAYKNPKCRMCNIYEETQQHILEDCMALEELPVITKEMIFQEDPNELKITVNNLNKRMEKLEEIDPNSTSLSKTDTSVIGRSAR